MVVLPSAWVAAEVVRSWPSLGGSWASLGASQSNQPVTLASASLGGVWLTSFLLVAANTALVGVIVHRDVSGPTRRAGLRWRRVRRLGPAWYLLGPAPAGGPTVRVALVQPGDIADSDARQAASEALTATLAGQRPDLVVWGESSVGQDLSGHPEVLDRLAELSRRVGADLLVNVDAPAPGGGIYKSAVLIGEHGSLGTYQKTRLVPFGEYVPLRPLFGWITRHSKAAAEDRQRGTGRWCCARARSRSDRWSATRPSSPTLPVVRRSLVPSCWCIRVPPRHSKGVGRSLSWPPSPRCAPSRRAARRCMSDCPATARPSICAGRRLAWCPSDFRGVVVVDVPLASNATLYQRLGDWVPVTGVCRPAVLPALRSCGGIAWLAVTHCLDEQPTARKDFAGRCHRDDGRVGGRLHRRLGAQRLLSGQVQRLRRGADPGVGQPVPARR